MTVWVDAWQLQCCGKPFGVGSRVSWTLAGRVPSWVIAALGAGVITSPHPTPSTSADRRPIRRILVGARPGNALPGCDDLSQGMSGRRDRQARLDQRDRPDRTEPALANEPIESIEASEQAEPIDRIEPADPIDRIDPEEPMDKMDPLEPMLKIDPAEPVSRRETSLLRIRPFSQRQAARPMSFAPGAVYPSTGRGENCGEWTCSPDGRHRLRLPRR
jgi:hypothetical protein